MSEALLVSRSMAASHQSRIRRLVKPELSAASDAFRHQNPLAVPVGVTPAGLVPV
jgi:hypothetical protein